MFAIPNVNAACAPISFNTSVVDLLSRPLAVNLAYSPDVTLVLSISTVLSFSIPNVNVSCLAFQVAAEEI